MCGSSSGSSSKSIAAQMMAQQLSMIQFQQQMQWAKEQQDKNDARVAALDAKYAEEKRVAELTPALDEDFMSGASLTDKNERLLGTKRFIIPLGNKNPTGTSGAAGLNVPA